MANHSSNLPLAPLFSSVAYIRDHWKRFLFLGIALIIIGFLAVAASVVTSFVTIYFIGFTLLIGGIAELIHSFWARGWSGFFLSLLMGLLSIVAGGLCLGRPVAALAALTLLIGSLFLVSGIFKIAVSAFYRFEHWGWIFFSGIISAILGGLVLAEWPAASLWVIGLFVGVDLIFYGWTWVLLAIAAKPPAKA